MSFMTPLQLAIHSTFHEWPGGLPAAAAALGIKREQVLRNKAAPHCDTNHLTLAEAMKAMLITGDHRILRAMADELGVRVLGEADKPASFMRELMTVQAENGDVSRTLADAIADGNLTLREAGDIKREAQEAIAAMQRLLSAVDLIVQGGGRIDG